MTQFGSVLSDTLKAARLSQSRAAELAGYDHSYLCRLCLGQRAPTREFLDQLVAGCGFRPDVAGRLYEAAGFIPTVTYQRTREDAALQDAARVLTDETIPQPYRDNLRRQIIAMVGVTRQMAVAS